MESEHQIYKSISEIDINDSRTLTENQIPQVSRLEMTINNAMLSKLPNGAPIEALDLLRPYLYDIFLDLEVRTQNRWSRITHFVTEYDLSAQRRRVSSFQYCIDNEEPRDLTIPQEMIDFIGDPKIARMLTRNSFTETLKYLQHSVSSAEELEALMTKNNSRFLKNGRPRTIDPSNGRSKFFGI